MKQIIVLLVCLQSLAGHCQDTTAKKKRWTDDGFSLPFSAGVIFQRNVWTEFGVNYGRHAVLGPCGPSEPTMLGRLSAEATVYQQKVLVAPKIGFELGAFLALKVSAVRYQYEGVADYRLVPELGIDVEQLAIFYGWNIGLQKQRLDFIPKHRFSLSINF